MVLFVVLKAFQTLIRCSQFRSHDKLTVINADSAGLYLLVGDVLGAHEAVYHHRVKLPASRNLNHRWKHVSNNPLIRFDFV